MGGTGRAGGVGFATAQLMTARGARVVIADIAGARAEELAATLPGAIGLFVDLEDEASIIAMVGAKLTPAEARTALKLRDFRTFMFLLTLLFRRSS